MQSQSSRPDIDVIGLGILDHSDVLSNRERVGGCLDMWSRDMNIIFLELINQQKEIERTLLSGDGR